MPSKKKTKAIGTAFKPIENITKSDPILPINTLLSKKVSEEYRKQYLQKMLTFFNIDEIVEKWSTSSLTAYKLFLRFKLPIFKEENLMEKELNELLSNEQYTFKEIRNMFCTMLTDHSLESIAIHYDITLHQLDFYGKLFSVFKEMCKSNNTMDENFSLTKKEKEMEIITKVESDGLVKEILFKENTQQAQPPITVNKVSPMSIISFFSLPRNERTDILRRVMNASKTSLDVEKTLGIPSNRIFRVVKARHMIFDFNNKAKLKKEMCNFSTFEECQKLVYDIIKNNRYSEFKLSEKNFKIFAANIFGVSYSKIHGLRMEDWETFSRKAIKQTIAVYKNGTRETNLTALEVSNYEKGNRKIITNRGLVKIARSVIMDLHNSKQSWISIFDFKTEIEKSGFELDDNERLVDTVDTFIAKNSFKSDYFTLKKIEMENPVLSAESSIRWDFVEINPERLPVVCVEEEPLKEEVQEVTCTVEPIVTPNNFILNTTTELSFNDQNMDAVLSYVKNMLMTFGSGKACISITKE